MLWFVAIFSFLFAVLAYKKLDWAVLLLIFGLPSYLIRFKILGLPFTLLEAMILIAFFVWLLKERHQIFKNIKVAFKKLFGFEIRNSKFEIRKRYPFDIEISLLLIISFLSVGIAGLSNDALGIWKAYFFEPVLVFILLLNIFQTREKLGKIIYALAFSAFFLSIYAIFQKVTGLGIGNEFWQAAATRRVTSVFPYPNALALFLTPLIMVFWGQAWTEIKKWRGKEKIFNLSFFKTSFLGLVMFFSFLAIFFARSEGGLIALVFALVVFLFFVGRAWRWLSYGVLAAGLIFLILVPGPRTQVVEKATLSDLSGEIRKQQWRETWQMLTESNFRFIFGSGLANYQGVVKPYHQEGIFYNRDKDPLFKTKLLLFNQEYKSKYWQPVETYLYPHNIFLNFWVELGIIGMLLFVWVISKYFYLSFRNWRLFGNCRPSGDHPQGGKLIQDSELEIAALRATTRRVGNYKEKDLYYLNLGLLGAMTVIIIHGLVDVPYFKNDLAVLFWILLALLSLIKLNLEFNNE